MNKNTLIIIAGVMGFLGVGLGAFGAHGLGDILSAKMMETYKTGILYHLIHSVVLLVIALAERKEFTNSFYFIFAGIILFSFSLYLYAVTGVTVLAIITPFGGLSFLIGWLLIILTGFKLKN